MTPPTYAQIDVAEYAAMQAELVALRAALLVAQEDADRLCTALSIVAKLKSVDTPIGEVQKSIHALLVAHVSAVASREETPPKTRKCDWMKGSSQDPECALRCILDRNHRGSHEWGPSWHDQHYAEEPPHPAEDTDASAAVWRTNEETT